MKRTAELVTTGDAARMLGVSRQHVVDLCDEGRLACERIRVHRRVRRDSIEAMRARRTLTREETRSLWLNRAVAAAVARDPARVLSHARRNLDHLERVHEGTPVITWLRRWRAVLDQGPETVMEVLSATTPDAAELRQNSPFAGVLPDSERRRVLTSFGAYWHSSAR